MTVKKIEKIVPKKREKPLEANPAKSLGEIFSKMSQTDKETIEKILLSMIDDSKVEMITDIEVPLNITRLELLAVAAELRGMPKTSQIITKFCKLYRVNRVSYGRQSREEVFKALSERLKSEDRSLAEKLAEVST